ncbi:MAG: 2-amino-4-hydroxy-6-hydroxymethyldihydropteridine diphosphokinase [Weeksellaceae bacterium]|nr:2-amino-4-hydroxy-6-hydroxymethyldihydropteridine diphosphokinase [Weeksellaceae bacterium]
MSYSTVVLLLGSNINNPENNIKVALLKIENQVGSILKYSELITTEPIEFDSDNNFCNIAIQIKTQFSPIKLLKALKEIEVEMGRLQDSSYFEEYRDRIIDIDIILYNSLKFISKRLIIPHSRNLFQRDFAKGIISEVR